MTSQETWEDRDIDFENEEANEESADLELSEDDFKNLLVAPADWTIGTLYSQIGKQIDLDPDFQRRNVWNAQAKSRFIESLFLGIPIPQILLSARPSQKSSFLVLDGKQRLLTIKEFLDGKHDSGRKFRLRGLRVLKSLEGKSWDDIKDDTETSGKLLNETQRTSVLRGWKDDPVLYEIFFRINSGSVKLSPMELRMSLFPGPFLKYIIRWTESVGPLHHLLKKRIPDSRMADVELAVRFLAFKDDSIVYNGDLKKFLDKACVSYNSQFDSDLFESGISGRLNQMNEAIKEGIEIFGVNKLCRKFNNGLYETSFNRAIFDVVIGSLSEHSFRQWAKNNRSQFRLSFEELCGDLNFRRSVETTTKSTEATRTRFELGYSRFSQLSGCTLNTPAIAPSVSL
jgi:hypothetical protein